MNFDDFTARVKGQENFTGFNRASELGLTYAHSHSEFAAIDTANHDPVTAVSKVLHFHTELSAVCSFFKIGMSASINTLPGRHQTNSLLGHQCIGARVIGNSTCAMRVVHIRYALDRKRARSDVGDYR